MIKLALNIVKLSIPALIEFCRTVITAMTGNLNFTTPNPPLVDITAAIDTLEATYQLGLRGDHNAKQLQKEQRSFLNSLMIQLKTYVENTAGENLDAALSSGIKQRKTPTRLTSIDTPVNVLAIPGSDKGTGSVSWNAVKNRTKYLVYSTTDMADLKNQDNWTLVGNTGQRFMEVSGLTSATSYAFFVIALGTRDVESEASDPALMMAA